MLSKWIRSLKKNSNFVLGYLAGLSKSGSIEIDESVQEKMADHIRDETVKRLEEERDELLKFIEKIHENTEFSKVRHTINEERDVPDDSDGGDSYEYFG